MCCKLKNYELESRRNLKQRLSMIYKSLINNFLIFLLIYVFIKFQQDFIPTEATWGILCAILLQIILPLFTHFLYKRYLQRFFIFYRYRRNIQVCYREIRLETNWKGMCYTCTYLIFLMIFGLVISYNFVPHFFGLIHSNGKLEIANVSSEFKSFQYPLETKIENYSVTTLYFKNNSAGITQGCICYSTLSEQLYRIRKPRLFSFYSDLTNNDNTSQTYIKFPSVSCGSSKNLVENATVYYKIYGNLNQARQSECPPKNNNFIMAFNRINISLWKSAGFTWSLFSIVWIWWLLTSYLIRKMNKNQLFYFFFGPFGILLFLYDIIFVYGCDFGGRNNNQGYVQMI